MDFDNRFIATVAICSLMAVGIIGFGVYSNSSQSTQNKTTKSKVKHKESKKTTTFKPTKKSSDTDESDDNNSSNLRGYKQTSSGNTTTYFNRELSASERTLLGDMTPKRIDSTASPVTSTSPAPSNAGSAWNAAGTWEEKNITEWTKNRLKDILSQAVHSTSVGKVELHHIAIFVVLYIFSL